MSQDVQTLPKETSFGERFAYSAYFAGQNIIYIVITTYLLTYYVSQVRLDPALVAVIFLIVRIWDAVNDPLIGLLMDRVEFLNSRFKGWINVTAFLMPAATFLMFLVPLDASLGVKLAYVVVTYLIWDVLYTASEVPIFAVSTSMTTNERERTILLTLTQIGSVLGAAIGVGLGGFLFDEGVDATNWLLLGGIPAVMAVVLMVPQMFAIQERHHTDVVEGVTLGQMIREVLRNDQHLIIMSLYLSQAFLNAVAVFGIYVAERYYGDARLASFTSAFALLGVVGLGIITPAVVRRWGKKTYLEVMMIATIVLSIPVFFIPGDLALLAMVFLALRTMTLVVTSLLRPMFTADCVEYGEQKTGIRNEATAFSIQTFFNKSGDALGTSLGGFVLAWVAFDELLPVAEQSVETINALWLWFIILPMFMAAVMWLGSRFLYKLDEETVAGYIIANKQRNEAAAAGD
ncbi:MAG: MFS transporter [Chloroflexi bacterium]|nr:MFS transporter [Chloroflexota bacterium]